MSTHCTHITCMLKQPMQSKHKHTCIHKRKHPKHDMSKHCKYITCSSQPMHSKHKRACIQSASIQNMTCPCNAHTSHAQATHPHPNRPWRRTFHFIHTPQQRTMHHHNMKTMLQDFPNTSINIKISSASFWNSPQKKLSICDPRRLPGLPEHDLTWQELKSTAMFARHMEPDL